MDDRDHRTELASAAPGILFVSPVADAKGGAERVLMEAMGNPAIRPVLAVPGLGELATFARQRGIPVYHFDLGAIEKVRRKPSLLDLSGAVGAAVRCATQIVSVARAEEVAAVQTNGLKVHVAGALARVLTVGGIRFIPHLHDIPYTRLERAIWRGLAAASTRTIVVSPPCMPEPQSAKISVVSNGCTRPPARQARQYPGMPLTIGFVGRFHPFKGVHVLLNWFESVAQEYPGLRLLLRGQASAESAAYWASLQPQIAALGDRCRVEGWRSAGADPYEDVDLLVVPSTTPDPGPLVLVEAMSAAIPVIGTPMGGIPTMIGKGEVGRLVKDAGEFAAALRDLLQPDVYEKTSDAALRQARTMYSLDEFWARLDRVYRLAGVFDGGHGVPTAVVPPRVTA